MKKSWKIFKKAQTEESNFSNPVHFWAWYKIVAVFWTVFNDDSVCVKTIVQFSKIVLKETVLSFSKNDYQLHENWQLAAVLAGLQGRGSTREKEGNVIQQIFFCATATTLLYHTAHSCYYFGWKMEGGIQALKSVSEAVNTNCVTKPLKNTWHWIL